MTLWHYTCEHGAAGITRDGVIRPSGVHVDELPWLGKVAWFTDVPDPTRGSLGLTSWTLSCDRMTHRFQVVEADEPLVVRWLNSTWVRESPREVLAGLHAYPACPGLWWVTDREVRAVER